MSALGADMCTCLAYLVVPVRLKVSGEIFGDDSWLTGALKCQILAVVRGTTNPAPCCHLANDTDLLTAIL